MSAARIGLWCLCAFTSSALEVLAQAAPPEIVQLDDVAKWGSVRRVVEPKYPESASKAGLTGYVDVEGSVRGDEHLIEVVYKPGSEAASVFVPALEEVMAYWRFMAPIGSDCLPLPTRVTTRVWFELDGSRPKISVSRRTQPYDGDPKAAFARSGVKKRVSPVFPREAIRGGHTEAFAYAAVHVDATGEVTETRAKSFPEKTGSRLFELETRSATSKWEFHPAAKARIYCALVHFALR